MYLSQYPMYFKGWLHTVGCYLIYVHKIIDWTRGIVVCLKSICISAWWWWLNVSCRLSATILLCCYQFSLIKICILDWVLSRAVKVATRNLSRTAVGVLIMLSETHTQPLDLLPKFLVFIFIVGLYLIVRREWEASIMSKFYHLNLTPSSFCHRSL